MKAGWVIKTLDKIAVNLDNRRIPITKSDRASGEYPYYGASGIVDFVADYIFDCDTLLVSEDGANLLARSTPIAFPAMGKYWVNNHAHILKFDNLTSQRFVELYLESIPLDEYITGAAQPKLNQKALNSIPIPFPPLPEQHRIVNILDEAFDGIATAKANAEKNLLNARAIFESHLQSVFTQRGEGWVEKKLGDMATFRNGINFNKSSKGEPIKILGVKDFQRNYWAPLSNLDSIIPDGIISDIDTIQKDDLVFVRSNGNPELIGRCVLIGEIEEKTTHSGFTIRTRLHNSDISATYLCHFLKSNKAHRVMIDGGNGVNIKSLNQGTLSCLVVPFPSITKQISIVEQIEELQEETQRLESIYQQKLSALDALKKSLLDQAFTGQL